MIADYNATITYNAISNDMIHGLIQHDIAPWPRHRLIESSLGALVKADRFRRNAYRCRGH